MLKKIVFVNKNYYSFKNFRLPLAKKLLKKNPNYEIFSIFGGPGPKKRLKNIKCLSMKISQNLYDLKNDLNFIFSFRKFLKKEEPYIVHFFNARPMLLGNLSTYFLKKKIKLYSTVTGLGHFYLTDNFFLKILLFPLFYLTFKNAQKIFFHNNNDKNYFFNKGLLRNVKPIVSFGQGIKLKKKIIKKIDVKNIKFGFVGRLTKEKGFLDYLESIKIFQDHSKYKNFAKFGYIENFDHNSSVAVTKSMLREKLKKISIKKYKYQNSPRYLDHFDVIVYPSYREGCSKTLMEACNLGKLIITTNVPGCNNIIMNSINGILVEPKSPKLLSKAYEKIFNIKNNFIKIQKKSKLRARQYFDEKKILNNLIKEY
jgi:glycosyltransferase involved in cell wall biosynthesis